MQINEYFQQAINYFSDESWILKIFFIVLATVCLQFIQRKIFQKIIKNCQQTNNIWDHILFSAMNKPLGLLIWIIGISIATKIVPNNTDNSLLSAVDLLLDVGVIVVITWFFTRFISKGKKGLLQEGIQKGKPLDVTTAEAISKLLRASVIITAALIIIQKLGYSISGLLAFGGIGGIAIGFAAKDLLANFFGGLMIYLDRPFNVGDWIPRQYSGLKKHLISPHP